ncbi:anaphase-promoting complex, cyclosome, subunit 4-domain-containing protein [Leucosporidium creatinivorum]|uniref:Anaphase-promoting complex subunit 4 n=1 Tax=Leucosporidium creatinivorum TaxID=106004 RepID=A0A1Y2FN42_9BASI|nr:anaphase-promoting complex, cyclosome, subunit 4-domain-containing protein [Leucosporidium creatinivorum]
MAEVTLPLLSSRLLPTASQLQPSSCCPTRDLAALSSSASSSTASSADHKLSLYRTTGSAHLVWEWSPPPPPPPPAAPAGAAAGGGGPLAARRALMAGKGKATSAGEIQQIAWSPDGNHLAVALRSPSPTPTLPSTPSHSLTLHLLSLHSGTSPLPPLLIPPSATPSPTPPQITHLSWQPLHHPTDPLLTSRTTSIIASLPPLAPLSPPSSASATGAANAAGGGGGATGGLTHGQGGVFGAKNAMLQREREKEMGRAIDLKVASPGFPTLLPSDAPGSTVKEEEKEQSLLLVGTNTGDLHLYLGGSIHLGSIPLASQIESITIPASSSQLSILLSTPLPSPSLTARTLSLPLPPSLHLLAQSATSLRFHLNYACEALQEARGLWEESRRIGKAWLSRLGELSKSHGVTHPPPTQLLHLLLTGRPTRSLHDFLASKMNERGLSKWENATAVALEKLKEVGWSKLQVAVERVVLRLEELGVGRLGQNSPPTLSPQPPATPHGSPNPSSSPKLSFALRRRWNVRCWRSRGALSRFRGG